MKPLTKLPAVVALLAAAGCQTTRTPVAQERDVTVTPFLMFQDGRAEEAINHYIEVFGDGHVIFVKRYGPNGVGPEGSIQHAAFEIHGQRIMVTESPVEHVFGFTPSVSMFVDFDSAEELDRVFHALSEGGEVMMPLGSYFFADRFAFIQDRFGVSWQLHMLTE